MHKALNLKNIICVLPADGDGRAASEIIYRDGARAATPVRPETVLRWIAEDYCIDLARARRKSAAECHLRKGAPIPIGPGNVFLPFHLADGAAARQERRSYAFCNVANQTLDVSPAQGRNQSLLRLANGKELLTDWSPATLHQHIALAVDTHRRLLRSTLDDLPLPAPSLYMGFYMS